MNWFEDVYLVNAQKLSDELREGSITEYQSLKHLILTTILVGANVTVPVTLNFDSSFSFGSFFMEYLIYFFILGAISYYGLLMCYQTNSKGDGSDFFLRVAALGLPVMIRVAIYSLIAFIPLSALVVFLLDMVGSLGTSTYQGYQFVFYVAVNVGYFITLRKYIANAAGYT